VEKQALKCDSPYIHIRLSTRNVIELQNRSVFFGPHSTHEHEEAKRLHSPRNTAVYRHIIIRHFLIPRITDYLTDLNLLLLLLLLLMMMMMKDKTA